MRLEKRQENIDPIYDDGIIFDKSTKQAISSCHKFPLIKACLFVVENLIARSIGYVGVCGVCFLPERYRTKQIESYWIYDLELRNKFSLPIWSEIRNIGQFYGPAGMGFYCELVEGNIRPFGTIQEAKRLDTQTDHTEIYEPGLDIEI